MRAPGVLLLLLLAAVLVAGCAGEAAPDDGSAPATTPSRDGPMTDPATTDRDDDAASPPIGLDVATDRARADVVDRTGGGTADIRVVVSRVEEFRDSSFGCPQPGEMYAQARVRGHRIILARGDRAWLYTGPLDQSPTLCHSGEKDGATMFVPPPGLDD